MVYYHIEPTNVKMTFHFFTKIWWWLSTKQENIFCICLLAMWIQCSPLMGKTLLPHANSISPLSHLLLITWFQLY